MKFPGKIFRIFGSHTEAHERTDLSKNRAPQMGGELRETPGPLPMTPTRIEAEILGKPLQLYRIEDGDLERIFHAGENYRREVFLVSAAASLPSFLNWLGSGAKFNVVVTSVDGANLIGWTVTLVVALIFGVAWRLSHINLRSVIQEIRSRRRVNDI
jgi:hypothetical protein